MIASYQKKYDQDNLVFTLEYLEYLVDLYQRAPETHRNLLEDLIKAFYEDVEQLRKKIDTYDYSKDTDIYWRVDNLPFTSKTEI